MEEGLTLAEPSTLAHTYAGRVAVLTGAGSGMGRSLALALAAAGARVVVSDRDGERAKLVAGEAEAAGGRAAAVTCDVTDARAVEALARVAFDWGGDVDFLFNHVGASALGPAEQIPVEDWFFALDVCVLGTVRALRAFLPSMIERGQGHVINTSSVAGLFPVVPDGVPYTTAKFAVFGLSQQLFVYLRPKGVRVSCFCPGAVRTGFGRDGQARATGSPVETFLGRGGARHEPDDVARHVLSDVAAGRFLIVTEEDARALFALRAHDLDAALEAGLNSVAAYRTSLPTA